jgi:thiamine kinase-like enzyme
MNETERQLTEVLAQVDDWQGRSVEYTPVTGGITNPNFLVTVDDREFFLKIPGRGTDAFIDRDNCHAANRIAADAGIGPPTAYYFPDSGIEIVEWLAGYRTMTFGDVYEPEIFLKSADLIRAFHSHTGERLPLTQTAFEQTFAMLRRARELNMYLPPEIRRMDDLSHQIEEAVAQGGIEYRPSHNDYYCNNIMVNDETGALKLIDFEYASMNDPCYDMGVYSGANYFTEEMDIAFIERYYGDWNPDSFARLKLYKILADIKWSMWSLVQHRTSAVRFDYMNWFGTKMARLRGNFLDPRIDYWLHLVASG